MLVNTDNVDDIFNGIEVDIKRQPTKTSIPIYNYDKGDKVHIYPNPTFSTVKINCLE